MGITVKATVNDKKWRQLRDALANTTARVHVGVLSGEHEPPAPNPDNPNATAPPPIGLVELAAIHEFGSPAAGIPERSFIRSTLRARKDAIRSFIEAALGKSITKLTQSSSISREGMQTEAKHILGLLGTKVVAMMRETIRKRIPPPLKQSTITRKKSSVPLVDTGQLINSINYEVTDK